MNSLSYELAKKLKDAGFPSKHDWDSEEDECISCGEGLELTPCLEAAPPTLSELIEACPLSSPKDSNKTFTLTYCSPDGEWIAGYEAYEDWDFIELGLTREEAVAKVWLAVNEKKHGSQ